MRKILLVAALAALTVVLGSCAIVIRELPLDQRLQDDVLNYLQSFGGEDLILYTLTVDSRDFQETEGTLDYECTVWYSLDEYNEHNETKMTVQYVLDHQTWVLADAQSDISQATLDARILMQGLFLEPVELPESVLDTMTGTDTAMSDALLDFTAQLNGQTYKFPCPFADFILSGWAISETSNLTMLSTVAPQSYLSVPMVLGENAVTLYVANQEEKNVYLGEGTCIGGVINARTGAITLAGGITARSTADEVLAAYGEPYTDETISGSRRLTYQSAANSRISFRFSANATQIVIFTLKAQAAAVQSAPLFDAYRFAFTLDGEAYRLPARLDTFTGDGWTIAGTERTTDIISWYERKTLTLEKDGASVDVVVRNLTMGDQRLYAASVTEITLDASLAAFTLTGVDGEEAQIRPEMTADAILAVLGEASGDATEAGIRTVAYLADDGRYVRLTFDGDRLTAVLQAAEIDDTATDTLPAMALKVNIGGNAYTLPADAANFREKGWIPACGWDQPVKAGSFVQTVIEDRRAEEAVAYFVNTGKETANLEDCIIAGLYAGTEDADIIVGRSVQQGAAVSEAYNIFGIPSYDMDDGDTQYLVYGKSVNRFLCVRSVDDQIDAIWVVCFTYE